MVLVATPMAAAVAAARRLLSRRASSFSASARLRRGPAAPEPLLRPAVFAAAASRLGFLRGMARRPGSDGYSPMRSGGGGDRAPTEMAPLFPGCDYEHWLIVMDKPGGEGATKQQMIDCYIQTLAKVVGSEEAAKKKIYNVSCERYFGFGCEIDEETSNKLEGLPGVLFVLPDSYKDYGAEFFVNGEIVQRPPERQRRVEPVPQRAADRPRYNDSRRLFSSYTKQANVGIRLDAGEESPRRMMTMVRPMLACCKLYISEGRNASALRAIERAARRAAGAGALLVNRFTDHAYNRVGYTLVSPLGAETATSLTPLQHAVFGMVSAAFEAIDFGSHAGTHPRLGAVDHVCFHPLAQASLDHVAALTGAVAADIGDKLQVPTFLYGAAHREGRTLASIRRQLGYFKPDSSGDQWRGALDAETLPIAPDAGPERLSTSKGVTVVGATGWVDNYNVPVYTSDVEAVKRIARRVSERGGGLRSVQAMGLAHGGGVAEVACNLLDPGRVGAEQVQDRVQRLADAQGFSVGKGYFTDFSQQEIIELYLQSAKTDA